MSEYFHVEKPFLDQLRTLGWTVVDQGHAFIPSNPAASLRVSFREWLLPAVFRDAVRAINRTADGSPWLSDHQLDDLRDQLIRHPSRTLLEANEAVQKLLFKSQVDVNQITGEPDPVVRLIDFAQEDLHHSGHRTFRQRHPPGGNRGEDWRRQHGEPHV